MEAGTRNFLKRHRVGNRYVWVEIVAKRGVDFVRFQKVCPFHCLPLAKSLHDEGWHVNGIYAYYTPVRGFNTYEEAPPWVSDVPCRGLTNGTLSLAHHCDCAMS